MTIEDDKVYTAEAIALEGTPLADRFNYRSLIEEGRSIVRHGALHLLVGDVKFEEGRTYMTSAGGYARLSSIVLAPTSLPRLIIPHEIAHVVHGRSGLSGRAHGPEYRSAYVAVISSIYGREYGDMLRDEFEAQGLPLSGAMFPIIDDGPIYDIPQLVRWI